MQKLIILLIILTSGISMISATPNLINKQLFEQSNLSKLADSVVLDPNAPANWDYLTINISGESSKELLPASGTTMYKFTGDLKKFLTKFPTWNDFIATPRSRFYWTDAWMFDYIEREWKIDNLINSASGGCGIIFNFKFNYKFVVVDVQGTYSTLC
ncbi:hypothetical protein [Spiroplasma eriocheiris]|uniref:Uncharacterized protein n=1 Tax=Spiroplasma eriocheiris TaxID=315358 RepID=A0A0H3XJX4_9MOLU|nr:hypothetical protein [Spiroplasma eriocheiris]AHF57735.1 hypothetical protein SPE_0607 [Spiroplasma eriocheiris CCTCC M 207170]AKM54186.1 hypothetical protein SERIO_v1c06150 [Spiroplasma eriocheiris]